MKKFEVPLKSDKKKGTLREDQYTFIKILSRLIPLRRRNVSDKCSRENQNTHLMFSKFFPQKSCRI
jgi:hypothetical protein